MSHPVRDTQDRVDCSQLRSYVCPKCGATGDQPQKGMSSTNGFASLCSQTDILKQFVIFKIHYQHNVVWKQDKISLTFHQISQTIKLWNQFNFDLRDTAQGNPPHQPTRFSSMELSFLSVLNPRRWEKLPHHFRNQQDPSLQCKQHS